MEHAVNAQHVVGVAQQDEDEDGGHDAGDQGADTGAQRAHAEAVDKNGVDHHVHQIHDEGVEHGDLAVAHGAEEGGAGVIEGDEGVGQRGGEEVDQGAVHHVRLDVAEEEGEDVLAEDQGQRHQEDGHGEDGVEKLTGGGAGIFRVSSAQVLGDHHRAAGGEGGKDLDDELVDVVHQRDAGDGSLTGCGDHDGVHHAHAHEQKLLDDQGNDETGQSLSGEEGCLPCLDGCGLHEKDLLSEIDEMSVRQYSRPEDVGRQSLFYTKN